MRKYPHNAPCRFCKTPIAVKPGRTNFSSVKCGRCKGRLKRVAGEDLLSPPMSEEYDVRVFPPHKRVRSTRDGGYCFRYQFRRKGDPFFMVHRHRFKTRDEAQRASDEWHERAQTSWNTGPAVRKWEPTDAWIESLMPDYTCFYESEDNIESLVHPVSGHTLYWLVGEGMSSDDVFIDLDIAKRHRNERYDKLLHKRIEPCVICGKKPVVKWRGNSMTHDEPGCPNKVRFVTRSRIPFRVKTFVWNVEFAGGLRQNFGLVRLRDLYLMGIPEKAKNPTEPFKVRRFLPPEEDGFIPVF